MGVMQMTSANALDYSSTQSHYQLVEIDSSVRPAQVTILSVHQNKDDATEAWKASAFAKIDFVDISHRILEI